MQSARDMMGNIKESVQEAQKGHMDTQSTKDAYADMFSFLENIPNSFYYMASLASVFASLGLFLSGKRWESLFVGMWAPTIITASMFYKLLRPSREVRNM